MKVIDYKSDVRRFLIQGPFISNYYSLTIISIITVNVNILFLNINSLKCLFYKPIIL